MIREPRILLFDIESMPDLDMVMHHLPQMSDYPGLTLKASINSVVCFGYKIFGEAKTHCLNAWDYPGWKNSVNDDFMLLKAISEIMVDADAVVSHNGKRFDWKFIQTRLVKHGLPPLPKIIHIDTCQLAKTHLMTFNNRLQTLAKFMTKTEKLENTGWQLWERVIKRDKKAMELMTRYCKQDVNVLNEVFKVLRPFATNIPNYNKSRQTEAQVCPNCGSTRLMTHGTYVRKNHVQKRFLCKDCGTSCSVREGKDPQTL